MFVSLRTKKPASTQRSATCRREASRHKFQAASITCWSDYDAPTKVAAIETDSKGARLMIPFMVMPGETISVALGNEVGLFETRTARVVWTQTLELTGKIVAGLAFEEEAYLAA